MDITARMTDHALLARTAAAGSMVLLRNVGGALPLLPLEDGTPIPVAVFGAGQLQSAYCTADVQPWRMVSILDGLCANAHIVPDGLLAHRYRRWTLENPAGTELPESELDLVRLTRENAAAIVVVTRQADDARVQLTREEASLVARVRAAFERTILILNTPGFVELGEAAQCAGIVFAGLGGQELGHALADVLTGVCAPGGHLAFTWPEAAADHLAAGADGDGLCGYRYYDTLGKSVLYPFGWGLGYGNAAVASVSVALDGYTVIVKAAVENTSADHPVQALVQTYFSNPASQRGGAIWILNRFEKTRLLAPGEAQTVQMQFPITACAVFRPESSAFVLEAGYYDFRVGLNSRATCVAGSVRLTRDAVVQACTPLAMETAPRKTHPEAAFTYPEEAEELAAAHKRAIRFSDRWLPRVARRRGDRFLGCRGDGEAHTLTQLRRGECSAFTLVAGLDDHALREFVLGFGKYPADVPGALGASLPLDEAGIPAYVLAGGGTSLALTRDIYDEETEKPVRQQCCTAFPAASVLACSFDPVLLQAVGAAVGQELRAGGVTFWRTPGCDLLSGRTAAVAAQLWSEDPVVAGTCAAALAKGVRPYGAAVLHAAAGMPERFDLRAWREVYGPAFAIAAGTHGAVLLPDDARLGEDAAFVRAMIVDWKYPGMFLTEGDRSAREPGRLELEKSALRILNILKQY